MEEEVKTEFRKLKELARLPMKTESEMKMVEIIMLKFHDQEAASKAAVDVILHSDWPFKLTVYDNEANSPNISKIWNKLIRESTCDYVLIMDSDVFVSPGWLSKMMRTFEEHPDCYLVLPSMRNTSGPQQIRERAEDGTEILDTIFAAQCVLYKKELFEHREFDEDFLLYGQDSLFGYRFLKSRILGIVRRDVFLDHIGSYSIDHNFGEGNIGVDKSLEREYARELFNYKKKRP